MAQSFLIIIIKMYFIGFVATISIFFFCFRSINSALLNAGFNPILEAYTIASATLLSFISYLSILNYLKPSDSHCKFTNCFERKLSSVLYIWNAVSLITFFLSVTNFPSTSTYGVSSLFYLCLSNAPLFLGSVRFIVRAIV